MNIIYMTAKLKTRSAQIHTIFMQPRKLAKHPALIPNNQEVQHLTNLPC